MNQMVTIPREEYDRLRAAAEDLADLQAYDRAKAALNAGEDELLPEWFADRLMKGEHPLRLYRDLRGMTQSALAEASGVNRVYIAEIENFKKPGSTSALKNLAAALQVEVDDLI